MFRRLFYSEQEYVTVYMYMYSMLIAGIITGRLSDPVSFAIMEVCTYSTTA